MASKYQKRHYEDIAETFRTHRNRVKTMREFAILDVDMTAHMDAKLEMLEELQAEFMDTFERDNPNFNRERFDKWVRAIY